MSDIKLNYITPDRLVSGRIVEYDIQAANANILLSKGYINEREYNRIISMPKMNREIYVGNMMKNHPEVYHTIRDGMIEYIQKLITANHIKEDEIVRIANDAICINRMTDLTETQFDHVLFRPKLTASNMININRVLVFSNYDNNQIDIETKGLGDLGSQLHQNYMLKFIANVIYLFERVSMEDAISSVTQFYADYVNRSLPMEYYRTFDSIPSYQVMNSQYMISGTPSSMNEINISYNLNIIRELYSILMENFH